MRRPRSLLPRIPPSGSLLRTLQRPRSQGQRGRRLCQAGGTLTCNPYEGRPSHAESTAIKLRRHPKGGELASCPSGGQRPKVWLRTEGCRRAWRRVRWRCQQRVRRRCQRRARRQARKRARKRARRRPLLPSVRTWTRSCSCVTGESSSSLTGSFPRHSHAIQRGSRGAPPESHPAGPLARPTRDAEQVRVRAAALVALIAVRSSVQMNPCRARRASQLPGLRPPTCVGALGIARLRVALRKRSRRRKSNSDVLRKRSRRKNSNSDVQQCKEQASSHFSSVVVIAAAAVRRQRGSSTVVAVGC
mmetsp:Transcript_10882/g.27875  ORF Transcript_10882/g.27875 Transcript_10882/m.27875 type:complete len:303 (+) Transcript_10882:951-1859(+)